MNRETYAKAGQRLHDMLDTRNAADAPACLLRIVADDMQQTQDGIGHALTYATARIVSDPANTEFWRRLTGSLRKASAMV